jgi:hypothetical protein
MAEGPLLARTVLRFVDSACDQLSVVDKGARLVVGVAL